MTNQKNKKHQPLTNSIAQGVMFLKMQNFQSSGWIKILNRKNLFFQCRNFFQKKCSKFSFDHIFCPILMKFEPDTHFNATCQPHKAVICKLSIIEDFSKRWPKNKKINILLSWLIIIFCKSSRLQGFTECMEKNT